MATVFTEAEHPGAFIVSEAADFHCRDQVVVAVSQTVLVGSVLGKTGVVAGITSSVAADAGNTGNGVFTIDASNPVAAGAKDGVYRVVNDLVAANGGEFQVFDPDGIEIGRVAVAATFNNQIKFVIADGATDWAIGDAFSVTVGIEYDGDEQYELYNPTGTDGSQRVAGIAVYPVTTGGSATAPIAAMVRGPAQVRGSDLNWNGATTIQIAEGIDQLRKLGIIVR